MAWARDALGFNTDATVKSWRFDYPPQSFGAAFAQSQSPRIEKLYRRAELMTPRTHWWLPYELGTWPGGQLVAIGRNGRYVLRTEY